MADAGIAAPLRRAGLAGSRTRAIRTIADALVHDEPIHWDGADALGSTPHERLLTRELRSLAWLSAHAADPTPPVRSRAGSRRDLLGLVLVMLAAAQILGALALLVPGPIAVPIASWIAMASCVIAAATLLGRGRDDAAAWSVGVVLLLVATLEGRALVMSAGPAASAWWQDLWHVVHAEAFIPVAAWRAARACPGVVRFSRFDACSRVMRAVAFATSIGLVVVHDRAVLMPRDASGVVLTAWVVAAVLTIAVRSGSSRRVAWQSGALAAALATYAALQVGVWPPTVDALAATIWPWLVATPWLWRTGRAGRRTPEAAALDLMAHALRPVRAALMRRRDRKRGSGLARVAACVACGRTTGEIAATLLEHMMKGLDVADGAVLVPSGATWVPLAGVAPALPCDSGVAALLATAGPPLRVRAGDGLFGLLPARDRAWLQGAGLEVVAPLTAADGRPLAALALGARRDGRPHTSRDLAFVAAAASTATIALQAEARRMAFPGASDDCEQELALECVACGGVATAVAPCGCGAASMLASLPARLADKFVVERRIGRGGMGVVYLARDERLGRQVALKTLPRLRHADAAGMHAEARAMAAVAHPAVAVLYELHVWRDTPVLVTEYLAGGTLAARLTHGPMAPVEAVALATSLADALADLHADGWMHGDIKPSNIGFGRAGTPKLLDFGLARLVAGARTPPGAACPAARCTDSSVALAGTPRYLSPQALEGRGVGAHADAWALSVVLFEMVAGVHPFRTTSLAAMLRDMHRRVPDVRDVAPHVPAVLALTLQQALHPDPSRRIVTAAECAAALRQVSVQIGTDVSSRRA